MFASTPYASESRGKRVVTAYSLASEVALVERGINSRQNHFLLLIPYSLTRR
ncbi:hypothetical protein AWB65_03159 [Caballeronia humi]|uniref:Uncharacterized protein n=1 Tax=Caballeronia humi TaxID=326474 RepID=A0A158HBE2_9BURK|nr:hypothetical protein AWB65_03159 [Caballeronia humi]